MDTIVIQLNSSESLALMKAIKFRMDYLGGCPTKRDILEEMRSLGDITKQVSSQISQLKAKARTDEQEPRN